MSDIWFSQFSPILWVVFTFLMIMFIAHFKKNVNIQFVFPFWQLCPWYVLRFLCEHKFSCHWHKYPRVQIDGSYNFMLTVSHFTLKRLRESGCDLVTNLFYVCKNDWLHCLRWNGADLPSWQRQPEIQTNVWNNVFQDVGRQAVNGSENKQGERCDASEFPGRGARRRRLGRAWQGL